MNKPKAKKRIEKLKKVINYHRYLYHILDKQEISDAALDSLKHELFQLEQNFPDLQTIDSPTQRVGGKPLDKFDKVEHKTPMLSIEDIFDRQELEKWHEYLERLVPDEDLSYFCELKIDGFAISLIYKKGILTQAATRGDGRIGEDVTQNIKTIESIPLKLDIFGSIQDKVIEKNVRQLITAGEIEVRGEIYMEKESFEAINKEREKQGEAQYANPRNLAAGSIRQLNPKLAATRDLRFLAYDIPSDTSSDIGIMTHSGKHTLLSILGFKSEKGKIYKNLNQIEDFWQKSVKKREKLEYQIDGIVITVNNNLLFNRLGVAGKSPRCVRALKFAAKQATTVVEDIKIQVGRTGTATPVAFLKPVNVGGATITRATLHNKDQIERLGVKIGDTVIIERAGDVIPAVVKVLNDLRSGREKSFQFPEKCPVCGTKLVNLKNEVAWRCVNSDCPARKTELLEHFISKKAFNIEGLGPKIIEQLIDEGIVSGPVDIFDLKEGDLLPLERFAEKSVKNLIEEIEKRRKIPLARFQIGL
jgi:DNA ligase (NAD+)